MSCSIGLLLATKSLVCEEHIPPFGLRVFFKKKRKKKQLGKSSPTFLSAGPISPTRLQLAARFTEGRSPAVHCWVFVGSEWHSARPWFILFLSSVWTKLYSSI
jgi:hypothetical protein